MPRPKPMNPSSPVQAVIAKLDVLRTELMEIRQLLTLGRQTAGMTQTHKQTNPPIQHRRRMRGPQRLSLTQNEINQIQSGAARFDPQNGRLVPTGSGEAAE